MLSLFVFPLCCIQTRNCPQVLDVSKRFCKADVWPLHTFLIRLIFVSAVVYRRYELIWLRLHHSLIILMMVCLEARAKKLKLKSIEIKIYHLKLKTEILLKAMIQTFIIFLSHYAKSILLTSKSFLKQCSSKCN